MAIVSYLTESGDERVVRPSTPLPVLDNPADTLLVATTTVTTDMNRDLLGNIVVEIPTLDGCGQYRRLVWFYFRQGDAATTFRILTRVTDHDGTPLGAGWQQLFTGTLPGGADTWGRIEIPIDIEGYYDQYRIEVRRTSGEDYTLRSKLIGVR